MIITSPHGYHFGFNMGVNVNEAVNIAVPQWLKAGLEASKSECSCLNEDKVSVATTRLPLPPYEYGPTFGDSDDDFGTVSIAF